MAEGVATKATANQTQTPAGQSQIAKPKHPPRGDLRYCLELKTNEAIIRCSEESLESNPAGLQAVVAMFRR